MSVLHVIIPHFLLFSTSLFDLSMPTRVLPHSARWLLANNRREEAIALLRKAALVNGRVLPPTVQVCVCVSGSGSPGSKTVFVTVLGFIFTATFLLFTL